MSRQLELSFKSRGKAPRVDGSVEGLRRPVGASDPMERVVNRPVRTGMAGGVAGVPSDPHGTLCRLDEAALHLIAASTTLDPVLKVDHQERDSPT